MDLIPTPFSARDLCGGQGFLLHLLVFVMLKDRIKLNSVL